ERCRQVARNMINNTHFPSLECCDTRRDVRNMPEDNFVNLGHFTPVVIVTFEYHFVTGLGHKLERPRSYRSTVKSFPTDLSPVFSRDDLLKSNRLQQTRCGRNRL